MNVDKASLSVAIVAILIGAGGFAYTSASVGSLATNDGVDALESKLGSRISSGTSEVAGKIDSLSSDTSSLKAEIAALAADIPKVKAEQKAIRSAVESSIGDISAELKTAQAELEAQQAAATAEKAKTSQALKAAAAKTAAAEASLAKLQAADALVEAAKGEDAPLIYGVIDAPDFSGIVWPRFREAYPWAPTEGNYIEGFSQLRARFVSEYQAGVPTADILWQSEGPMAIEMQDYLEPFPEMAYANLYPDSLKHKDHTMYTTHLLPAVLMYNTNLVTAEEAPKTWLELGDPKWKGKTTFETIVGFETTAKLFVDLYPILGDAAWTDFVTKTAANEPHFTSSNTEAYVKVLAGEYSIGIALINDIIAQDPETPIAIAWPTEEPLGVMVGSQSKIGVTNKAANPNFAKLFVQWLESPVGQRAIGETGRPPALSTVDSPAALGKVMPTGMPLFPTNEEFFTKPDTWEAKLVSFFFD